MNWIVFSLFALAGLILETSLIDVLDIRGVRPTLLGILAMFVSFWAPRLTALWACFLLGLFVDLTSGIAWPRGQLVHILGPHGLGYAFACALVLQLRAIVLRRQPLAFGFLTALFVVAVAVVVVALFTIRSWYSPEFEEWSALGELARRLGVAFYSGVIAIPLGWLLMKTTPMWGFQSPGITRGGWR